MNITRTPTIEADSDFNVAIPITKSYVDNKGARHLIGVATGVAEDRDGERCSVSCVKGMGRDIEKGGIKVTSAHQQDWMTEIGDVRKGTYDPETDELSIEAVLPAEGVDPIADKAWKVANNEKVGWSIGGKLVSHFYERNEVGKRRKVLDAIQLRHIALTKNPSYAQSFATAVAKTYTGDDPADDEFTLEGEVEKDMATGSWVNGSSDGGGGNVGRDSVGSGKRNAGSRKPGQKGMRTEDTSDDDSDTDGDDGKDLPKAKNERHLACPNCGHEFAADLPVDPDEQQLDDENDDEDQDESTGKSVTTTTETALMQSLQETLDALKAKIESDGVTKTADPEPTADEAGVSDVEKMVAASHQLTEARFEALEGKTGEGFELVAKALKDLTEKVADLPLGRKSQAYRVPPTTGHADGDVEKSTDQLVDEAPDAVSALKVMNEAAGWTGR